MSVKKLLVVQVAGLGHALARGGKTHPGPAFQPLHTVFPALTSPVQASFRTASPPARHGVVANGWFFRELGRPLFWEQSAALVRGKRIWRDFRRAGGRVAVLFWQQSLGEEADVVLSPAPIHRHGGGMIQDVYTRPAPLYAQLCRALGRRFQLRHYWGPLASPRSSAWIAEATAALLRHPELAPDLCLTYLPGLDYDLQRHGPDSAAGGRAWRTVQGQLARLLDAARERSYETLVFGDYALGPCRAGPVFPNRALRAAGFLQTRRVGDMVYSDLYGSRAFAVADHEIAHVYVPRPADLGPVRDLLSALPGVESVADRATQADLRTDHARGGELLALARPGYWFAYPWWEDPRQAPEYARHVDIHNKPGYDPCELLWGWPPGSVSLDATRIRGSHGRADPTRQAAWSASFLDPGPASLLELAARVQQWLTPAAARRHGDDGGPA